MSSRKICILWKVLSGIKKKKKLAKYMEDEIGSLFVNNRYFLKNIRFSYLYLLELNHTLSLTVCIYHL